MRRANGSKKQSGARRWSIDVPASRSRTDRWRQSLEQIQQRNGSIEITLARHVRKDHGSVISTPIKNLLWRVRVLALTDTEIVVEQPTVMGKEVPIHAGAELVAVMNIGQNQWMFHTRNTGPLSFQLNAARAVHAIRLTAPTKVERCQRRSFYRVSTVGLLLPIVRCASLMDVRTAIPAEEACRVHMERLIEEQIAGVIEEQGETIAGEATDIVRPEVGDAFDGALINIGGGGVGLLFDCDAPIMKDRKPRYWLEFDLTPISPAPLGVAAQLVHTRINSAQRVNAGFAFTF